jgi:hypothetical protein
MDFLTYIKQTEQLNDSSYINDISDIILTEIINKIVRDASSLEQLDSFLNHPFFKNIAINKKKLVERYKKLHP